MSLARNCYPFIPSTTSREKADLAIFTGFMTFCPEWLTGNQFLDSSNFMYLWVYLVFFNMLWVFIPFYAIYVSWNSINAAFSTQTVVQVAKKSK